MTAYRYWKAIIIIIFGISLSSCGNSGGNGKVIVTVNPDPVTLHPLDTQQFTATVTGLDNSDVEWLVIESYGGSITPQGLYSAPATPGVYHVKATSLIEPTKYAIATVYVVPAQGVPEAYSGTLSLKRNKKTGEITIDEEADCTEVVLLPGMAEGWWLNDDYITVTAGVDNRATDSWVFCAGKTFVSDVLITLIIEETAGNYSITVGTIIVPQVDTSYGVLDYDLQGVLLKNIPLPVNPNHLTGTETIIEFDDAIVELTWDLSKNP